MEAENSVSSEAADIKADIHIEVAYAEPDTQVILNLTVPSDATIEQAIKQSGILTKFPDIDLAVNKVGVFGKLSKLDKPLRERDRIEIYRKLIADPKAVRKQRAAEGKKMRKGGAAQ
ncbi:MAG: RnfH family protein [Ectothiorhodospiraceae bacterium]|nr:RnfH family protein [Ectothiorhodospiraceae bacterium]